MDICSVLKNVFSLPPNCTPFPVFLVNENLNFIFNPLPLLPLILNGWSHISITRLTVSSRNMTLWLPSVLLLLLFMFLQKQIHNRTKLVSNLPSFYLSLQNMPGFQMWVIIPTPTLLLVCVCVYTHKLLYILGYTMYNTCLCVLYNI